MSKLTPEQIEWANTVKARILSHETIGQFAKRVPYATRYIYNLTGKIDPPTPKAMAIFEATLNHLDRMKARREDICQHQS